MKTVYSPRQLLTWLSPLKFSNKITLAVVLDDAEVVGIAEVLPVFVDDVPHVTSAAIERAVDSLRQIRDDVEFPAWVLIRGWDTKFDSSTDIDLGFACLDFLKADWKSEVWISDMCQDSACCNPDNPPSFAVDTEAAEVAEALGL